MHLFDLSWWGVRSVFILALISAIPAAAEQITVVSWGGAYQAAQREAVFDPFTAATGIAVEVIEYDGTAANLAERARAGGWDVIDMLANQAHAACAAGALLAFDPVLLIGDEAWDDFAPVKPTRCAIPQNVYARVVAYDSRAYPGAKPTRIADFFNTERFPGKRAVQKSPDGILEWALMAEGVPASQVYGLLSTDRGLSLAFRRLERIRESIVWWTDPKEPAQMLEDSTVAMATGFNGRFFAAKEDRGVPLSIVWDARLTGIEVWTIAANTDAPDAARQFLIYAAGPDAMARLAERIPYGPARRSAFERVGLHPGTGTPMLAHLPNAPQHGDRALLHDSHWYTNTESLRWRRFEAWLAAGEQK